MIYLLPRPMAFFVLSNRDSWFSLELELKVSPIFWEVDFSPCKKCLRMDQYRAG
jgi:hypothetical protein